MFDINMPLLYGEEEKAFRRLQVEIINTTPDLSIFAWKSPLPPGSGGRPTGRVYSGLLAESPLAFSESSCYPALFSSQRRDFVVTNVGIKTRIQLKPEQILGKPGHRYVLLLDCCGSSGKRLGVRLRKCGPHQFVRDDPFNLAEWGCFVFSDPPREIYLLTRLPRRQASLDSNAGTDFASDFSIARSRSHVLQIELPGSLRIYDIWPLGRYDDEDQLFFVQGDLSWDSATFKLYASFVLQREDQRNVNVSFQCTFFAIGWSDTTGKLLQCSIVDDSPYATALSDFQSRLDQWEPDRLGVTGALKHHKIPRSPAAAIKFQGTDFSTLVSFKLTLVRDPDICANEFWRLKPFFEVYKNKELPEISDEEWSPEIYIENRQR
jgi:hypothetical protein